MSTPNPRIHAAAQNVCNARGYELLRPLGSGAFKSAFLVRIGEESQQAALKVAEVGGLAARLEREVQALRSCEHPSVARILGAFPHTEGGSEHLIVLEEYLGGGTLEDRIAAAAIPPADVRFIGARLAEVLGHLRDRNLVHRDIKPANILFRDAAPDPVLTDFGIVRDLNAPTLTADFMGMGPGTPAFAAPEQLANEKALIDWRTDQFDLGLVLAYCVLGRHAYQRTPTENIRDAIRRVAAKEHLPAESRAELDAAGFSSLVRALEPWPVGRYRRPEDLVRALS